MQHPVYQTDIFKETPLQVIPTPFVPLDPVEAAELNFRREAHGGIASRFFQGYGRLVRALGRDVSDVAPARHLNGQLLLPFSGTMLHSRMQRAEELIHLCRLDAGLADSIVKGLALAEAEFCKRCAVYAREELRLAEADEQEHAELIKRVNTIGSVADQRDQDAVYFMELAESGKGW